MKKYDYEAALTEAKKKFGSVELFTLDTQHVFVKYGKYGEISSRFYVCLMLAGYVSADLVPRLNGGSLPEVHEGIVHTDGGWVLAGLECAAIIEPQLFVDVAVATANVMQLEQCERMVTSADTWYRRDKRTMALYFARMSRKIAAFKAA